MPSKTTGAERQKRYRDRMAELGLRQITVYWPSDRAEELRDLAATTSARYAGEAYATLVRQQRNEPTLPLEGGSHDD